jgi:endonuclease III
MSKAQKTKKAGLRNKTHNKKSNQVNRAKRNLSQKVQQINKVITRLEKEVESLLKKIVHQGVTSQRELRKHFDELFAKVRNGDWKSIATDTRDDLEREVRRLGEEAVQAVRKLELLPQRTKFLEIFREVRRNVSGVVEKLTENNLIYQARATVDHTRKELLGILSIPTQEEVEKLEKKIVSLEKRLSNITRKAA